MLTSFQTIQLRLYEQMMLLATMKESILQMFQVANVRSRKMLSRQFLCFFVLPLGEFYFAA